VGKQAVALVNLALANHREACEPTDEKGILDRMIWAVTLVESLEGGECRRRRSRPAIEGDATFLSQCEWGNWGNFSLNSDKDRI